MAKKDLDEMNPMGYVVSPSAVNATERYVTLPEVTVKGKKHRPYKSAYDSTAFWDIPHAGLEALGQGMSYITPSWMQSVMPYLSPSQYVGMLEGKGLPGSETNNGFGSSKHDQYMNEIFDLAVFGKPTLKGIIRSPETLYNIGKTSANIYKTASNVGKYTMKRGVPWAPVEYAIAHSAPGKRAISLAMHSTASPNPTETLKYIYDYDNFMRSLRKHKLDLTDNQKYALQYVLKGDNRALHALERKGALPYRGYEFATHSEVPDLINTYLFGDNPNMLDVTNEGFGLHAPYIKEKYPTKANDIKVFSTEAPYGNKSFFNYEGDPLGKYDSVINSIRHKTNKHGTIKPLQSTGSNTIGYMRRKEGPGINVGGHRVELGIDDYGQYYVRGQDIWKFNPKDFMSKWLETTYDFNHSTKWKRRLLESGVNIVDEAGTPFITRTNWTPIKKSLIYKGIGTLSDDMIEYMQKH